MADLIELSQWEAGIYQLETDDPVLGGEDGIDNLQAKQLANRTKYLKEQVELRLTQPQVEALIAALVDSSPAALDTLNELAVALGNDPNFAATITNALALKAPVASPALTGNPTAPTQAPGTNNTTLANTAFVQALFNTMTAIADATTAVKGILKLATNELTQEGLNGATAVTPASLSSRTATEARTGLAKVATQAITNAGDNDTDFITPFKLKNTTLLGLGYGQTWQDMTASRSNGVNYTNTTGKPIQVLVSFADTAGLTAVYTINVGGVNIINALQYDLSTSSGAATAAFIVPNGVTYTVSWTNANLSKWSELR